MFTGIIEAIATVKEVIISGSNRTFWLESPLSPSFRVDQSVSHDGVCLTIEEIGGSLYRVTAIEETLRKSALSAWEPGTRVNLERSLSLNARLDGHFVQGHVDTTGQCVSITDHEGSREYTIEFPESFAELLVEKGSICLNGISLTIYQVTNTRFSVAIIPYTIEHTNIGGIRVGDPVNLEFDLLGKYIQRRQSLLKPGH